MTWRKSSYSTQNGACVEVHGDLSALRDSKNPDGPKLDTVSVRQLVRHVKMVSNR
jgi:hypothetical protein